MTAAEATVEHGGVIIMLAKSGDGHGGQVFYDTFRGEPDEEKLMRRFMATPPEKTEPDQWQSQIFARVLMRARVIFISDAPDAVVRDLHMLPAHSVEEAVRMADELIGRPDAGITVIPDGVSVIVA